MVFFSSPIKKDCFPVWGLPVVLPSTEIPALTSSAACCNKEQVFLFKPKFQTFRLVSEHFVLVLSFNGIFISSSRKSELFKYEYSKTWIKSVHKIQNLMRGINESLLKVPLFKGLRL